VGITFGCGFLDHPKPYEQSWEFYRVSLIAGAKSMSIVGFEATNWALAVPRMQSYQFAPKTDIDTAAER
ncbi:MAG: hypothetical protein ACK5PZ_00945, partial [Pirellula sp.]